MVKRIPCRVVSSVVNRQRSQGYGSNRPPMSPGVSCEMPGEVNAEGEQGCFPMGMFVDVVIGDK